MIAIETIRAANEFRTLLSKVNVFLIINEANSINATLIYQTISAKLTVFTIVSDNNKISYQIDKAGLEICYDGYMIPYDNFITEYVAASNCKIMRVL